MKQAKHPPLKLSEANRLLVIVGTGTMTLIKGKEVDNQRLEWVRISAFLLFSLHACSHVLVTKMIYHTNDFPGCTQSD